MTLGNRLAAALDGMLPKPPPQRLGLALSGGGDSVALLRLLDAYCTSTGIDLHTVTVDHGLREGAAEEAAFASSLSRHLGCAHETVAWRDHNGAGNLQARARNARYGLIADWAMRNDISHVCLAHTQDDQAETVLMRIARGSGVDGLSGMARQRTDNGVHWLRPLLSERRADLRAYLRDLGQDWRDDPSNEDLRFDRIKMRGVLTNGLVPGLDVPVLADTARRMGAAREVLGRVAHDAARAMLDVTDGDVLIDSDAFSRSAEDTQWRVLAAVLCRVSDAPYRPRFNALRATIDAVTSGTSATLHGCLLTAGKGKIRVARELSAVAGLDAAAPGTWDGRWSVTGPNDTGCRTRAMGDAGLAQVPEWRASGLPRQSALASPGVFLGDELVAAPLVGAPNGWQLHHGWNKTDVLADLISH